MTSDFESLYPNLIINYNCIRFPEVLKRYSEIKDERVEAKINGDRTKNLFSKRILNSTSGLLDNEYSWLYHPENALKMRLIGQLILTKLVEECILHNWQVISANTDGIEAIVPKQEIDLYQKTLDKIAEEFNLKLEHEKYKKIIYKNVNNYICETESSKLKQKGLFVYKKPLGDSVDELVIAKALEQYYINNIKPEEFIKNPEKYNLTIFDYCKSNKIDKKYTVYWNNEIQQNLNRYYFSKNKPYLFKRKNNIGTFEHINVGEGVILYNNHIEKDWKDYDINYQHYISQTNKIINEINNYNQLTLF